MNGTVLNVLAVGCGGFLGAVGRYLLSGYVQKRFPGFPPAGTLIVNVIGCLLIGVLMAIVVQRRHDFSPALQLFLITGILGSLTTFSTFGYETVELLREQNYRSALWNIAANLVIGLIAVWLGWTAMSAALPTKPA
ncbi:MAG: fluoride efflux transporter CrcB [Planctomycetes bacterium]|nr:fluoride efflux transporter CrcB [Planctomycetota bacterium]